MVMERDDYLDKMKNHFADKLVILRSYKTRYQTLYLKLKASLEPYWSPANLLALIPSPARAPIPKPYGLPKIHKPGNPLRIITPMFNSVPYHVSKTLDSILKPAVSDLDFRIQSSANFVENLKSFVFAPTHFLASVDAVKLFDMVDCDFFVEILPDILFSFY